MRMRSQQYRAWTSAHNFVACTCIAIASQPFRAWGLFRSWRCALQSCPMCCTNALMLFNLHCSCLSLTCIARFLAVHLASHVLVLYCHNHSACQLGSPWVPKIGLLSPANCANVLQICTIAPCPAGISCYLDVWRAASKPVVLPLYMMSRDRMSRKLLCRYFGWLTTRSAV